MNGAEFKILVSESIGEVSCLLDYPKEAERLLLLAHGAGAGMRHSFMEQLAQSLAGQGLGTLRFQFPYMEEGRKRPDKPETAYATIGAAYKTAKEKFGDIPVFLSGKSYGGRMSSQAVAAGLIEGAAGIIFYGFPLHAPGKPSANRGDHLFHIQIPMLFCQGTKDKLTDIDLMNDLTSRLGARADMYIIDGGDHSFKTPKAANTPHEQVIKQLAIKTREWTDR